ncbi:MAG TPA: hypothetical protein VII73_00890 [Caulobacteraceae bacterium]
MAPRQIRASLLRAVDGHIADFVADCEDRYELGGAIARADAEILVGLARQVARSLGAWGAIAADLDLASQDTAAIESAGAVVLEAVFDGVLQPGAFRILAAALALESDGR